jgi:hypothetical protein
MNNSSKVFDRVTIFVCIIGVLVMATRSGGGRAGNRIRRR